MTNGSTHLLSVMMLCVGYSDDGYMLELDIDNYHWLEQCPGGIYLYTKPPLFRFVRTNLSREKTK